ncbi:MAG: CDP-alcohol phosphatidyltransferase family protein [Flavobacteriales bacterium]|nr:CDP-alcohol phosphatidyltransferase family protein [Flavobacteriales bacterium]
MKKHIPNLITTTSLILASWSIPLIFEGKMDLACYLLIGSCFCDFFDGFSARLLKVSNPLGEQLDSLVDMVAFGVAPGILTYKYIQLLQETYPTALFSDISWLSYIAFLIPIMSAFRLAKFNIDTRQTTSFYGLATPANASFYIYIVLIYLYPDLPMLLPANEAIFNLISSPAFITGLTIFLSFMMVANVPMFSLKFKNLKWKGNEIRFTFIGLWAILMFLINIAAIPLIGAMYIVWSIITMKKNSVA